MTVQFERFKEDGRADWDGRYMLLAVEIGSWSKDRSRRVGCVIVGKDHLIRTFGYNGFPRRLDDAKEQRHKRPDKYGWTEHAERNAIFNAARIGVAIDGCTMYLGWFPCTDCARAIVQAGLAEIVALQPDLSDPKWGSDFKTAREIMEESGVSVRLLGPASAAVAPRGSGLP